MGIGNLYGLKPVVFTDVPAAKHALSTCIEYSVY